MKLVILILTTVAFAQAEIDWSKVKTKDVSKPVRGIPKHVASNGRIVGGQEAEPHSFPFQVGMLLDNEDVRFFCGGSIVSPNVIMTAAHCADGNITWIEAIFGAHNIYIREPEQLRIEMKGEDLKIKIHPDWNPNGLINDVALIILPEKLSYNEYIKPIKLPLDLVGTDISGQIATVSGWGKTSDNSGGITEKLRYVETPIISNEKCSSYFGTLILPTNICVDGSKGKSSCQGDSGGPITVDVDNEKQQVGIVSFGASAGCEAGYPSAFTRVTEFLPWIQEVIVAASP